MPGTPALRTQGVGVSFGGLRALHEVSLTVGSGEIVGVIGPNGAGKTTLFDRIGGFLPGEGRIEVGGVDVTSYRPQRRAAAGLGRSFQDARLFPSLTVHDVLRVACELELRRSGTLAAVLRLPGSRRAEAQASERSGELIEALNLQPYAGKLISELSTGTRRIVDLAGILARKPRVVLFDEPSSGIAQREAEALGPLLRSVRERLGCALLVIEHDMPLLLGLVDRVYALAEGQVIGEGPPEQIVRDPRVVSSYLGGDPHAIARSGAV